MTIASCTSRTSRASRNVPIIVTTTLARTEVAYTTAAHADALYCAGRLDLIERDGRWVYVLRAPSAPLFEGASR